MEDLMARWLFKVSELSQFPFMNDSWSSQYGIYVFPILSAISNI